MGSRITSKDVVNYKSEEEFVLNNILVYHGSNVIIETPQILENGFYKDFGYGFYCTNMEKQAKRWALTKRKNHIVNKYIRKIKS